MSRHLFCRLFPSGEALPSTISAGSCLPLFDRFLGVGSEEAPIEGCLRPPLKLDMQFSSIRLS
jgi:hypothetical protein